ncbi:alpha/beta hydrolase [Mycobacterium yunnanensis]|uniref:Alpha/beta hydrolase n=1 Tax=Mycobacterium yunnanensis TaxID=368477 RepID=A0A9X3BRU7_9MYCO|nr:alpha/beta hydrolase [Mycobacterium yunnanensis]MCV7419929.1 alpha/beta hydrolase [Mycobacterium yunnanensis]
MTTALRSQRWRDHGWLFDQQIKTAGIEFDQNRLAYSLGPVRDESSAADIAILRSTTHSLADLTSLSRFHAERHERLAERLEDRGDATSAGSHWFAAAQLWLLAAYPLWDTTPELVELHERKTAAFARWASVASHHVERVDVPFGDGALPGWLHLPAGDHDGRLPIAIAVSGMDGGKESLVNRVGDEFLAHGMAVLALDGPGQSEAVLRGIYTSPEAWTTVGDAVLAWADTRADLDGDRAVVTGVSFGSYFMTSVAANTPRLRGCAVALQCLEPAGRTIFDVAAPSYKSRHMWMAGLERDEVAFDQLVTGYDLRDQITQMSAPWFVLGGLDDELCSSTWVYDLASRCPAPASTLMYEGCRHSLQGPAAALGPFFRSEMADWLAARVSARPVDAHSEHHVVTRSGHIVTAATK